MHCTLRLQACTCHQTATFGRNKIGSVASTGMAGYYVVRAASSLGVESRACGHSSGISKSVNPLQQPAIVRLLLVKKPWSNGHGGHADAVMPRRAARSRAKIGEICIESTHERSMIATLQATQHRPTNMRDHANRHFVAYMYEYMCCCPAQLWCPHQPTSRSY